MYGDEHSTANYPLQTEIRDRCMYVMKQTYPEVELVFGMTDSIDVDGIHIMSSDKYDLWYFEIVVVTYEPK